MATATGLTITDATVTQTDVLVTGPSLVAGNSAAIQTFLNTYTYDATFGKTVATVVTINGGQPLTWTNMPLALTGLTQTECKLPMQDVNHARLTARVVVAGTAAAVLIAQFSLNGSSYTNGPQVAINTTGLKVSNLGIIPAQFKTDCFFRLAGSGGDGVADPQFGLVTIQFG
jgi:hypothetical protein